MTRHIGSTLWPELKLELELKIWNWNWNCKLWNWNWNCKIWKCRNWNWELELQNRNWPQPCGPVMKSWYLWSVGYRGYMYNQVLANQLTHWPLGDFKSGLAQDILKVESWTQMGSTANIIIKYSIHVFASICKNMPILLIRRRYRERCKLILSWQFSSQFSEWWLRYLLPNRPQMRLCFWTLLMISQHWFR